MSLQEMALDVQAIPPFEALGQIEATEATVLKTREATITKVCITDPQTQSQGLNQAK